MRSNQSAKDIAFEKERIKWKKEDRINHITIRELQNTIIEQEEKIRQLQEWNDRLLEFMDLSESDLKRLITHKKSSEDFLNINPFLKFMNFYIN